VRSYFFDRINPIPNFQPTDYACVAVILHQSAPDELSLCLIQRAHNEKDAWSGQVAFPGGRKDQEDLHDLHTATRETHEEVGLLLNPNEHIGYLSDVQARNKNGWQNFFLRPVVFHYKSEIDFISNARHNPSEVADFFSVKLADLTSEDSQTLMTLPGTTHKMPAVILPNGLYLWGLTYLIARELLQRLNLPKSI
jgi:8-oxo-dGTP pyrophosphatase MutT (NUDIX family)